MKALRGPHLVLAYIGKNHAVFRHTPEQFVEKTDRWLRQAAGIEFCAIGTAGQAAPFFEVRYGMAAKFRVQRWNRVGEIPDYGKMRGPHAIELRGIDFEVNNLGVRSKARGIARDPVVEARSEYQQEIGLVHRHVGGAGAVHTDHAQVIGSPRRNRAQAMHRGEGRNIQMIEQAAKFGNRTRDLGSRSDQRDRFRRLLEKGNDRVRESPVGVGRAGVRRELHRSGELLLGLQHVGRDIDHHRPRTSAARPVETFGDYVGDFVEGADQAAPLRQRKGDAEDVGFLECVGADEGAAHLAGDADQGNGIHLGIGDAGDQVGRAGATGRHRHPDFSGDSGVAFGREYRALLVARQDVAHATAIERVIERHDRPAGITENEVDAFGAQALQNNVGSLKHPSP